MTGLRNISVFWLLALSSQLLAHSTAHAHHGPTKAIEALSDRIAHGEPSSGYRGELLTRRGDEYRALGDLAAAAADYEAALELDEAWTPALYGLVHVHFERAEFEDAREIAERGLALAKSRGQRAKGKEQRTKSKRFPALRSPPGTPWVALSSTGLAPRGGLAEPDDAAPFHALLARIHAQAERWEEALQSWDAALASSQPDVDWYLGKAQLLWKLGRNDAAQKALRSATRRNPSEALKRAWYESLIRCGRLDEAQQHIDAGLLNARWKSTWLLLRARVHAARGDSTRARADALAALTEITQRLSPALSSPLSALSSSRLQGDSPKNPFLIADKAQALALLGHHAQAQHHAEIARSLGIPAWRLPGFDFASPHE